MAFLWSFWVLHGELGGALGESGASLGRLLVVPGRLLGPRGRAKGVFGRHFGSPQDVLGSPEGKKCTPGRAVTDFACIWLHFFVLWWHVSLAGRGLSVGWARIRCSDFTAPYSFSNLTAPYPFMSAERGLGAGWARAVRGLGADMVQ